MYSEIFYQIALRKIEGVGQATLKKMLKLSGSACAVFEEPKLWRSKIVRRNKVAPKLSITEPLYRSVNEEMEYMDKHGIYLCSLLDSDYPYRLKCCNDAPISFYYKGARSFNSAHVLAVVGTRSASSYGLDCVRRILYDLKDRDVVTVSGLAYGIDTEAHSRSIEFGIPTWAVMGCGLGMIYPHSNTALANQILETGGTLISEFDHHVSPDRLNFPQRNRIVAGISDAVLVVESASKGGSIITAYIAHSYNRDVFAVPGSIFDERHKGCHELICSNMAALVTSGAQIVEAMNWAQSAKCVQTALFVDLTEEEERVVEVIRAGQEVSIDTLSLTLSDFSPSKLAGLLLGLELKGVIVCRPGKMYALNP